MFTPWYSARFEIEGWSLDSYRRRITYSIDRRSGEFRSAHMTSQYRQWQARCFPLLVTRTSKATSDRFLAVRAS
ncbi:hypothetical protein A6A25_01340 [Saccharothrix sp. CB00851]|nr:hypothetical protein A6A25_01340 [Saccharothrix sp. CB00851]